MILKIMQRAWQFSGRKSEYAHSMSTIGRVKYMAAVAKHFPASQKLFDTQSRFMQSILANRPEYFNMIVSPYINAQWDEDQRIEKFQNHIKVIYEKNWNFDFDFSHEMTILDLSQFGYLGYRVVLDKPIWFHREGILALNLFKEKVRLFTLAFSIEDDNNGLNLIIGGIQGRSITNILEEYKIFTKLMHGMRPRDFLIEILRILASVLGVSRITAVSDEFRHHRHPFFGQDTNRALPSNYNEIWLDRGGVRESADFYRLPMVSNRDPCSVAAKKRAMYKKRYELLQQIEDVISSQFPNLIPQPALQAK